MGGVNWDAEGVLIASYKLLLPYIFHVLKPEELTPHHTTVERYDVILHPPYQAKVEVASFRGQKQVAYSLLPANPQVLTDTVKVNDQDTVEANLLKIDFKAPDFDRRRGQEGSDPPTPLVFSVANRWLAVLRTVLQSPHVRPINEAEWFWRLDYLTDTGDDLPASAELFKMTTSMRFAPRFNVVDKQHWERAIGLTFEADIPIYIPLILDAEAALPDVGAAITLASTALETLVENHLGRLAVAKCAPPELWPWITRRGFFLKEPSTEEQFDGLLKIFTGKSLKDEKNLWEAFKNLKEARNSFVHKGRADIGDKPVTSDVASRLVATTKDIIRWTEKLVPEEDRWLSDERPFEFSFATPAFPTV